MPVRSSWTAEEDAMLRRLAKQGLSASQIGKELGRTRSSIIGSMYRRGIAFAHPKFAPSPLKGKKRVRRPPSDPGRSPQLAAIIREKPPSEPRTAVAAPSAADGVKFMDIGEGQCRWPVAHGDILTSFRFCGEPVWHKDHSWCAHHFRLSRAERRVA